MSASSTVMTSVRKAERDGAFRKVAGFGHLIELKESVRIGVEICDCEAYLPKILMQGHAARALR